MKKEILWNVPGVDLIHDIPEKARVSFVTDTKVFEVWIDEECCIHTVEKPRVELVDDHDCGDDCGDECGNECPCMQPCFERS